MTINGIDMMIVSILPIDFAWEPRETAHVVVGWENRETSDGHARWSIVWQRSCGQFNAERIQHSHIVYSGTCCRQSHRVERYFPCERLSDLRSCYTLSTIAARATTTWLFKKTFQNKWKWIELKMAKKKNGVFTGRGTYANVWAWLGMPLLCMIM